MEGRGARVSAATVEEGEDRLAEEGGDRRRGRVNEEGEEEVLVAMTFVLARSWKPRVSSATAASRFAPRAAPESSTIAGPPRSAFI
eukprot:8681315-Pyramimonas_sp.AAC.1